MSHALKSNSSIPASFRYFWSQHEDARQGVPVNVAWKIARYHLEWHLGIQIDELSTEEVALLEFDPVI